MAELKLFMTLLGCKPEGRHTEQHDVFFGIGYQLRDLIPDMQAFWPEAKDKLHIDGWREVNTVDGHQVRVVEKSAAVPQEMQLFFLNLAHAIFGIKNNNIDIVSFIKSIGNRASRISGCRNQNCNFFIFIFQKIRKTATHKSRPDIFKSQCWSVKKF